MSSFFSKSDNVQTSEISTLSSLIVSKSKANSGGIVVNGRASIANVNPKTEFSFT